MVPFASGILAMNQNTPHNRPVDDIQLLRGLFGEKVREL
jgi:hypothetical protein